MNDWLDLPWKTSRWRIAVLRLVFPRREAVQIHRTFYILRGPKDDRV